MMVDADDHARRDVEARVLFTSLKKDDTRLNQVT